MGLCESVPSVERIELSALVAGCKPTLDGLGRPYERHMKDALTIASQWTWVKRAFVSTYVLWVIPVAFSVLTVEEAAAICLYTMDSDLYGNLNNDLRNPRISNEQIVRMWGSYLNLLLGALDRLPSYSGRVFRGLPKSLYLETEETWHGFSSCSKISAVCLGFSAPKGLKTLALNLVGLCLWKLPGLGLRTKARMLITSSHIYEIKTTRGKNVQRWSAFPTESEVLLPPGTKLSVVHAADVRDQLTGESHVWVVADDITVHTSNSWNTAAGALIIQIFAIIVGFVLYFCKL